MISGVASRTSSVEYCALASEKEKIGKDRIFDIFLNLLRAILWTFEAPEKEIQRNNYCSAESP